MPRRYLVPVAVVLAHLTATTAAARPPVRFQVRGDGVIRIASAKTGLSFAGRYRSPDGRYLPDAWRRISRVLGAPVTRDEARVLLRLVETLAFLQGRLHSGVIEVSSGYRSPAYNRALRRKGGVVAKASLHQYGMAVDARFAGVDPQALWRLAREHHVGGAGYYGNPWVHIDVGPPRFWTQGTAHVREGRSDHNKQVILVPEFDCFVPGETARLWLARVVALPIGVARTVVVERLRDGAWQEVRREAVRLGPSSRRGRGCRRIALVADLPEIRWRIPPDLAAGTYRLRAVFCDRRWEDMPPDVASYSFAVGGPAERCAPAMGSGPVRQAAGTTK